MEHPWNAASAALARDQLTMFAPTRTMTLEATPAKPLSREQVLAFARDVAAKALEDKSKVVVVYYVGHGGTTDDGDIVLFQGRGPHLRLEELDEALLVTGIPHALLVDQCMENGDMRAVAEAQGFALDSRSGRLDYVGPNELITDELSPIGAALRNYADEHPFLTGRDPVILAAKPGTVALVRANPVWQLGAQMGPLAARLHYLHESALELKLNDLGTFIKMVPQSRRLGEIGFEGSVSWSDFAHFERAAHAIRSDGHQFAAAPALVKRWTPSGAGVLKRFALTPDGWIGAVEWDLVLNTKEGSKLLMSDTAIGHLTSDGEGAWFANNTNELYRVRHNGELSLMRNRFFASALGRTHSNKGILALIEKTASGPRELWRLTSDGGTMLAAVDADDFDSGLVEWSEGEVFYTQPDDAELRRVVDGGTTVVRGGLHKPGPVEFTSRALYILSTDAKALYRLNRAGEWAVSDVMSGDPAGWLEHPTGGFVAVDDELFLLSSAAGMLELRVLPQAWGPMPRGD